MSEPNGSGPAVLIADDDEDVLELVSLSLSGAGYRPITAGDGEEALRKARENNPALAVLDVTMPKLTGYEVTEALRRDPDLKDIPIFLLTARAQGVDADRGLDAGADRYIRKPFRPRELRELVDEALGR